MPTPIAPCSCPAFVLGQFQFRFSCLHGSWNPVRPLTISDSPPAEPKARHAGLRSEHLTQSFRSPWQGENQSDICESEESFGIRSALVSPSPTTVRILRDDPPTLSPTMNLQCVTPQWVTCSKEPCRGGNGDSESATTCEGARLQRWANYQRNGGNTVTYTNDIGVTETRECLAPIFTHDGETIRTPHHRDARRHRQAPTWWCGIATVSGGVSPSAPCPAFISMMRPS